MTAPDSPPRSGNTDWQAVYAQLDAAQRAIDENFAPSPERQQQILAARAQRLAEEQEEEAGRHAVLEIVLFTMAHERYGMETRHIREVYPLRELTPIPCAPSHLMGIVTIRGQVLPLIDLKKLFGLPEKGLSDTNRVLVMHGNGCELGVLADVVLEVRTLSRATLATTFPTLTGLRKDMLEGVTEDGIALLNAEAILENATRNHGALK